MVSGLQECQIPEGVPIFLGKIAWECHISWGAKYPVTLVQLTQGTAKLGEYTTLIQNDVCT